MKPSNFEIEKEKILDQIVGGRCYYPDVKIWMHPFTIILVYYSKKLNVSPNALSLLNLFISIICLFFIYTNNFLLAFVLFWIRAILDCSDGALARYADQTSKFGALLDKAIDFPFYISFWLLIALKLPNIYYSIYLLSSAFLYLLLVEYYIEPRLLKLDKRAPVKKYFIDRGYILGFGFFTVFEFWTLAVFAVNVNYALQYLFVLIILTNMDIIYRLYEVIRYIRR